MSLSDHDLIIEIHHMLCRICSYLDKVESEEYREMEDKRAFNINVAADLYSNKLEELKDKIRI